MKNLIYLFGLFITILACCDPDEPCPTCFEDIVRCKVNGKEWVSNCQSNDPLFGCRAVTTHLYIFDNNILDLGASNDQQKSHLSILQGNLKMDTNSISYNTFRYIDFDINGNCSRLDSVDLRFNNYLKIDLIDTVNFIISGNFQARNYNLCGDTVTITDGYFKTKFKF